MARGCQSERLVVTVFLPFGLLTWLNDPRKPKPPRPHFVSLNGLEFRLHGAVQQRLQRSAGRPDGTRTRRGTGRRRRRGQRTRTPPPPARRSRDQRSQHRRQPDTDADAHVGHRRGSARQGTGRFAVAHALLPLPTLARLRTPERSRQSANSQSVSRARPPDPHLLRQTSFKRILII